MLSVVGKPLIQYAVEEALASGIEQIIFETGSGETALEDHFDSSYALEDTPPNRAAMGRYILLLKFLSIWAKKKRELAVKFK